MGEIGKDEHKLYFAICIHPEEGWVTTPFEEGIDELCYALSKMPDNGGKVKILCYFDETEDGVGTVGVIKTIRPYAIWKS